MQLTFDLNNPVYIEALTHSSYVKEHPEQGNHNEVLEFIGDAVLQLCITDVLVELYPNHREGDLTRMRHQLVDTKTLAALARELNLGEHIRLGLGEDRDGGRQKDRILANVVEALLGALYRLKGLSACQQTIRHHFLEKARYVSDLVPPKQRLMEWCQKQYKTTPVYNVVGTTGPSHKRVFSIGVWINGEQLATGSGTSKKEATIDAAVAAVKRLCQQGAMPSDLG